jgi:hypothetical protein
MAFWGLFLYLEIIEIKWLPIISALAIFDSSRIWFGSEIPNPMPTGMCLIWLISLTSECKRFENEARSPVVPNEDIK